MSAADPELRLRPLWLGIGLCLVAVIVYASLTPAPIQIDTGLDWQDKLFHTFAYFVLMAWFVQIYHVQRRKVVLAIAFIALGVGMEVIQAYTPERYFEYADMIANSLGVVIAYLMSMTRMRLTLQALEESFLKS